MQDNDTTFQQLERTEGKKKHDAKWEAAFLAQLTHGLGEKVAAFATRRARFVESKTRTREPNLSRTLYQDAVTDTWTGDVSWDPQRAPLELHLKGVIKSRTSAMLKRLDRFDHISTHVPSVALEREVSDALEEQRVGHDGRDLSGFIDEVIGALFLIGSGDDEVVQMLECFGRGIADRPGVMRETGMSATTYHNARRRMLRLVERLPQDVRDTAIETMA